MEKLHNSRFQAILNDVWLIMIHWNFLQNFVKQFEKYVLHWLFLDLIILSSYIFQCDLIYNLCTLKCYKYLSLIFCRFEKACIVAIWFLFQQILVDFCFWWAAVVDTIMVGFWKCYFRILHTFLFKLWYLIEHRLLFSN